MIMSVHPTLYLTAWGSFRVFGLSKQMFYELIKAVNMALRLCYINVYEKEENKRKEQEGKK